MSMTSPDRIELNQAQQQRLRHLNRAGTTAQQLAQRARIVLLAGRLIVRRVRRLNPKDLGPGQGELFSAYRHHGIFTDSPLVMLQAETTHRAHAIVEQVIADMKSGPLAHLPEVISSRRVGRAADLH